MKWKLNDMLASHWIVFFKQACDVPLYIFSPIIFYPRPRRGGGGRTHANNLILIIEKGFTILGLRDFIKHCGAIQISTRRYDISRPSLLFAFTKSTRVIASLVPWLTYIYSTRLSHIVNLWNFVTCSMAVILSWRSTSTLSVWMTHVLVVPINLLIQ